MSKYIIGGLVLGVIISISLVWVGEVKDNARLSKWRDCEGDYQKAIALPFTEQMKACMNK